MHIVRVFLFVTLVWGAAATPAVAQVDFSGVWAPIMHEDSVERAAGPDIGDFLGLPINDAARQRADQSRGRYRSFLATSHSSRRSLQESTGNPRFVIPKPALTWS